MLNTPPKELVDSLVKAALREDIGSGDITTDAIIDPRQDADATFIAKEKMVLAGLDIAKQVFLALESDGDYNSHGNMDGNTVNPGDVILTFRGPCHALLKAERTALNFLQRLCGIATLTRNYVTHSAPVKILDTRKTTPGLRVLEKYAVQCGGGTNHRFGLFDAVLIKDNHIAAAGGISQALDKIKQTNVAGPIEIEAATLEQVAEAIQHGVEIILLDNMDDATIKKAVELVAGRCKLEVSGSITLDRLSQLKSLGIDFISVGALTHSARAMDISMRLDLG